MYANRRTVGWATLLVGLCVLPAGAMGQQRMAQQVPAQQMQQMQRMQEQARLLGETMQRMQRIQTQAHEMEQLMIRDMERLRQQSQLQERDLLRLREQERVRDMTHAYSNAAREMNQSMERVRDMLGDPGSNWGPDMEREMLRLREHMDDMAGRMEDGLKIMDRIRDRLHPS
ncbi:MAG: hypothetical protein R3E98_16905 [Gemmatimonadota bacterium]|nr:hypothetical protein [Gemmatimonadota bacterium]